AAGLDGVLSGEDEFTVFAPTDDAFAMALGELGLTAEELLADTDLLTAVLQYHVVPGRLLAEDVLGAAPLIETVGGELVQVGVGVEGAFIGNAENGFANIVTTDLEASNGVIHVIDAVILPPSAAAGEADIVATADGAGTFATLLAAATEAGLAETLTNAGPFTVFAPTDEAFQALLDELGVTAEELLAREDLADILLYHVALGVLDSEAVTGTDSIVMLNGDVLPVESIQINTVDVAASNGIIHIIDAVLLPPADEAADASDPGY
ncbi:MAG: fasciclin domain-containing protein, partial [Chloroflexi bacterium]|nr:fasciclin domain-containing protein [Chloroflexota bacterium]